VDRTLVVAWEEFLELLHALNLAQLDHLVVGDANVVEIVEHGLLTTSGATSSTTYMVSS